MKKSAAPLLLFAIVLFSGACATETKHGSAAAAHEPTLPALLARFSLKAPAETDYLTLASRYRAMSPAEQSSEADTLGKAYSARHAEATRLQLALLLTVAQPPVADRARALALLDLPPGVTTGRGRLHPLAQLLLPLLYELRRLEEAHSATQQKLREQQLATEAMRQKLEALRDIELRLQERTKTP